MKKYRFFMTAAAIILFVSGPAISQDKDKIAPLPDTAALEESRTWLVKTINKYFGYTGVDDTVKISNLKFDGCHISYRFLQSYTDQKSVQGDRPTLGQTGSTRATDIQYSVYEDVSFDLKDINPGQIGLGPLPKPKEMQIISLETTDKKALINFNRKGTSVRYNAAGTRAITTFPMKEKAGQAVALGLMHVVKLCQAENAGK